MRARAIAHMRTYTYTDAHVRFKSHADRHARTHKMNKTHKHMHKRTDNRTHARARIQATSQQPYLWSQMLGAFEVHEDSANATNKVRWHTNLTKRYPNCNHTSKTGYKVLRQLGEGIHDLNPESINP